MTVEQLLNGVIYAGTIAGALSGIGVLFHFALVRPLRGFLRREIVANLVEISGKLDTNTRETSSVSEKLDTHIHQADERDRKINDIERRLTRHLVDDH